MNAENPRTSSICCIQACDVWSISLDCPQCPHLKYIFIEWRILHMTRYKLQIQESCPLKLAAERCPLQRRQWQRCSGQCNSSVQYSVAQITDGPARDRKPNARKSVRSISTAPSFLFPPDLPQCTVLQATLFSQIQLPGINWPFNV